ncbi:hypothetical protein YB2330_006413 [Saitoella coloradoensis]
MDSLLLQRRNDAVATNPPNATFALTENGSSWLWAVFSVMALSCIIIAALSLFKPMGYRIFYLLNVAVLATASVSYFSLASDLGLTPVTVEFRGPGTRQIAYVRYIDWFVTTPLLLTELLLTAGLPTNIIISTIFADLVMIITGLAGALVVSSYKWGYYTMGCVAMLWVFWNVFTGIKVSGNIGPDVRKSYTLLAVWLMIIWLNYPICWGLSEGGNRITVVGEMVYYGVLDLLAKPVFAAISLALHSKIDLSRLGLNNEPRMGQIALTNGNTVVEKGRGQRGVEGDDYGVPAGAGTGHVQQGAANV